MDPNNTFPFHYDPYNDAYEVDISFLFKEEEPEVQIDLTADDNKDSFGVDSEINLLNVAGYLNKNQSFSYEYENLEITHHIKSDVVQENDNSSVNNNECHKTLDKNEESSSDDVVICNLDEYFPQVEALNVPVNNESNESFEEYPHIKDVTGHTDTTNKRSSTHILEHKTNDSDVVTYDKPLIDEHPAIGNKPMHTQPVLFTEITDTSPKKTGPNDLIEITYSEANFDSSDDEILADIKREKERHKLPQEIIEETTLLNHSLQLKFIEQPSTSKGYLPGTYIRNQKDDDSTGYNSSDFEFISESEAKMVGFIKNKKLKSKETRPYFESSEEYNEKKEDYKKRNNDYRKQHVIPRGNAYVDMFRYCAPLWGGFMENKAFHVTSMSTEFEGIGFDLNLMPQYDDREDEEHIAESKEVAKYIERMYPRENRRRHKRSQKSYR